MQSDNDSDWDYINQLLNRYFNENDQADKLIIVDTLIDKILASDWKCIEEMPSCTLFVKEIESEVPVTPDKDTLQKLSKAMLQMIVDEDLVERSVKVTYSLLLLLSSIPKPFMKRWLFLYILRKYIDYFKCDKVGNLVFNLTNSMKSTTGVSRYLCDINVASLSYSFLLFLEEEFKFLESINRLLVNEAFCIVRDILILSEQSSTIRYKSILLIMKIFPLLCPTDGQVCKILLFAIMTARSYLKFTCLKKYSEIVELFYVNIKILNGFKGSNDFHVNKALFSVAIDIIIDSGNEDNDQWTSIVCDMMCYIPLSYLDRDLSKAVGFCSEIVKCYNIIESYLLNMVDVNLANVVKEFKEAMVEQEPTTFYSIFSLNKQLENLSRVWTAILNLVNCVDSFEDCSVTEVLDFLHKVVITEARLETIIRNKFHEYNFINDVNVPVIKIGEYIDKIGDRPQLNEYYAKLVNFLVHFLYVYGETVVPYVGNLFLLPWLQENQGNHDSEIGTATLEVCLDGLFNQIVATYDQPNIQDWFSLIVDFIRKIVERNPLLKNKYLDILPKIILITVNHGNLSAVKYLVDHIIGIGRESECATGFERKILCLISDRCCLGRTCLSWEVECVDCDRTGAKSHLKPVAVGLREYKSFVAHVYRRQLLTLGPKAEFIADNLKRYLNHSAQLRKKRFLLSLVDLIISHEKIRDKLVLCVPHVLYNWDDTINVPLALYILSKIVDTVFDRMWIFKEHKLTWVIFVIKVLLRLIQTPVQVYLVATIKVFILFSRACDLDKDSSREILEYMAQQHGTAAYEILTENEEEFSKFFVDIIIDNMYKYDISLEVSMTFIAKLFGHTAIDFLQSRCTAYMISHILLTYTEHQATYFINEIAGLLVMSVQDLITSNFHIVFTCIYFSNEKSTKDAWNLLLRLANNDLKTLLYYSGQKLMSKIFMNFHSPIKVIRFLMFLQNDRSVAMKMLHENVNGALTFIGSKLTTPGIPQLVIKKCLKVPIYLMKILDGQFLDSLKVKLLSTLRTVLPLYYNNYPHLCMLAWMLFVFRTDLTFLASNLTTIFIELLKLFPKFPEDVSHIFYYLVVKNNKRFRNYLPALYFVPDHSLEKMHQVWLAIHNSLSSDVSVTFKIKRALKYVNCDYLESRICALNFLQLELTDNSERLHALALKSETLDPLFEDILDCLMENIQLNNSAVKTACARCLGELGAIDPSRFKHCMEKRSFNSYKIETDEFAYICINNLLKELHKSKKSYFMNVIASTIQELLKLYLKGDKNHKRSFFSRFSFGDQYILEPLISTRHNFRAVTETTVSREMLNSPLSFQSPLRFAYSWAYVLVSILPNGFAKDVFTICLSSMNMDLHFCEAILPYIVLEAWKQCPDKCYDLLEEGFKDILRLEPDLHCAIPPSHIIVRKKSIFSVNGDSVSGREKCIQIVYDLLDFLFSALIDTQHYQLALKKDANESYEKLISALKVFLSWFPLSALSWKAYTQKYYYRSLFYLERDLAAEQKEDHNLLPLKSIFTQLNDLDSLFGITKILRGTLSTEATMLNDVVSGHLEDVVGAYERMAQKYSSTAYFRGLVQCYLNINQPYVALQLSKSFLNENLHVAYEMEKFVNIIELTNNRGAVHVQLDSFHQDLKIRSDLVRCFGGHVQEVLSAREKMFRLASQIASQNHSRSIERYFRNSLGEVVVELARLARKNDNLHVACTKLTIAEEFGVPKLFIEKAKYHRSKREAETALIVLKQGIDELEKNGHPPTNQIAAVIAKAKLLIAKYNEENMNEDYNQCFKNYQEAVTAYKTEKNYMYLANFLYRAYQKDHEPDKTNAKRERQVLSAENFSKSLLYGCKYVYQSMSCLLNLWLDYGARFMKDAPKPRPCSIDNVITLEKFNKIMNQNVNSLPSYLFMTSFSLILARVNHMSLPCYNILKAIIVNIIRDYPQQAMWTVITYYNSSDEGQKVRMKEILSEVQALRIASLNKFIKAFLLLVDVLVQVCHKKIPGHKSVVPLSCISKSLKEMDFLNGTRIMIPIQSLRTISLPNYKYCHRGLSNDHDPFPVDLVYFAGVKEEVLILRSIQRPKKLEFIGNDGKSYPMLCKSLDDLRLDSRIMEFNSLVNMCLARNPSSHGRDLHIRTYSVVPLNYECGLIEWVHKMVTFKGAVNSTYRKYGISPMRESEIKELITGPHDALPDKLKVFRQIFLPRHPPILHKWFFEQFSKAHSWYLARQAFIHTCAVMSIIGHIIGLGDRHGENILIDTTNGEVVHVDFNCIFDKGQKLKYPEVVPFRLTQNIVRAFGSTGVEGGFIRCCEIVCKVTRAKSDQLISIMKPFLYCDVNRSWRAVSTEWAYFNQDQELNEQALRNVLVMQKKLKGAVRLEGGAMTEPFSVEGQVRRLVNEAMNPGNLCRMYHGWGAFL
ncbi:ATR serine/threonine kinase meiotic 41 isoform X2 [Rhodnius prolixus]|uniref:ATR serine/threonine kinase meiotic 41 isoform X2 n=1 Tax=Rhodnius prolixus TaxID=13249 RepID=UPI003D18C9D5